MNNRKKLLIVIASLIIAVLLFTPRKFYINDGGSYGYTAALYEITFWRAANDLYPDAKNGMSLHIFPCFDFCWFD